MPTALMLIHAFVVSRVDYCNAVLSGTTAAQLQQVQRILNRAARLLFLLPKFSHVSVARHEDLASGCAARALQDNTSCFEVPDRKCTVVSQGAVHSSVLSARSTTSPLCCPNPASDSSLPLCYYAEARVCCRWTVNLECSAATDPNIGRHHFGVKLKTFLFRYCPLLFFIVLEALSREFRSGLPMELLYADDLVLMAETLGAVHK